MRSASLPPTHSAARTTRDRLTRTAVAADDDKKWITMQYANDEDDFAETASGLKDVMQRCPKLKAKTFATG